MGEIIERMAQSLARSRRGVDESKAALIRLAEAGNYEATHPDVLAELWQEAVNHERDLQDKTALVRTSFRGYADDILARAAEITHGY
jgi:hypothetical protein